MVVAFALAGLYALDRMSPVLYVAQPYDGIDPAKMEGYLPLTAATT